MNRLFDDAVHGAARFARGGACKLLALFMLGLSGYLIGVAGIGFLTVWVFLSLSMALGKGYAALLIGLGLTLLGAGVLALFWRWSKPAPVDVAQSRPAAPQADMDDAPSLIAFTAAFVLARYFTGEKRD